LAVHAIIDDIYNLVSAMQSAEAQEDSIQPIKDMKIIKGGSTTVGGYYDNSIVISCIGWTPIGTGGIGSAGYTTYYEKVPVKIPIDYYVMLQVYTSSPTASMAVVEYLYAMFFVVMQEGSRPLTIKALEPQAAQPYGPNGWVAPLRIRILSSLKIEPEFYADVVAQITETYTIS